MQLIYDSKTFGGLNLSKGSTQMNIINCDNFDVVTNQNANSLYQGFLTKFPKSFAVGDDVGSQVSRGIELFVPSTYSSSSDLGYVQAFSDGTIRILSGGSWTILNSGFTDRHFDFASYNALDILFWCNGKEGIYRWEYGWTAAIPAQDKGAGGTALTGNLTFDQDSSLVTGVGTAFTTELVVGSFIRRTENENWYEVASIIDDNNLTLLTLFLEASGSGGVGNSQKAATNTIKGRYSHVWKDRLWIASGEN